MSEITIEMLLAEVDEERKKKARKKRQAKKAKLKATIAEALSERPIPPSPWRTEAQVIPICVVTCRCGAQWETPASRDGRFLRRRHQRNGTVWEVPTPDGLINPHLPVVHKRIHEEVTVCHSCVKETDSSQLSFHLAGPEEWHPFVRVWFYPTKFIFPLAPWSYNNERVEHYRSA